MAGWRGCDRCWPDKVNQPDMLWHLKLARPLPPHPCSPPPDCGRPASAWVFQGSVWQAQGPGDAGWRPGHSRHEHLVSCARVGGGGWALVAAAAIRHVDTTTGTEDTEGTQGTEHTPHLTPQSLLLLLTHVHGVFA